MTDVTFNEQLPGPADVLTVSRDCLLLTENIEIDPELIIEDGYINAYVAAFIDVDKRLGTNTYGTDDSVNFFADYYPETKQLRAYYTIVRASGLDECIAQLYLPDIAPRSGLDAHASEARAAAGELAGGVGAAVGRGERCGR